MDYEKKYKEALERAEEFYNDKDNIRYANAEGMLEEIFPELKESEDERIRKHIISILEDCWQTCKNIDYDSSRIQEDIAWLEKQGKEESKKASIWKHWKDGIAGNGEGKLIYLVKDGNTYSLNSCLSFECDYIELSELDKLLSEKQGEQKPANKIEPKFKVGDWIVNNNSGGICQITEIKDDEYCLWPLDAEIMGYLRIIDVDNDYHLWTIQDAKDGDVVVDKSDGAIGIFRGILHHSNSDSCNNSSYCFLYCRYNGFFYAYLEHGNTTSSDDLIPATKEQRDLLFSKMKEAGYEWDAGKKELKKISQRMISAEAKEALYDKPAYVWSEEDEKMCQETIDWFEKKCFPYALENDNPARESIKWLKSLKQRYTWKPSEEQMKALHDLNLTGNISYAGQGQILIDLYNNLKNLKGE